MIESKYVLKKKLSQGGFGKVYLAFDKVANKEVVIKVNSEVEMNQTEFKIMSALSGISGFPKVFSSGMIDNQPYIV